MALRLLQFLALVCILVVESRLEAQLPSPDTTSFRVMTFNILQGGDDAGNVGFGNSRFGGSRIDELANVIKSAKADVVGVQEDCRGDQLLTALGRGWTRQGSIYARFKLSKPNTKAYLAAARVDLSDTLSVTIVNCHWFPPANGYGPDVVQSELRKGTPIDPAKLSELAISRCRVTNGPRGYNATMELLKGAMEAGEVVILTGDFNEPSHLDWTAAYTEKGSDRWVVNPTKTPLRFAIDWPGSKMLEGIGMIDSYRTIHRDEVAQPGITWTPEYPDGTPGRRSYKDQCLDRIDRIYHFGKSIKPTRVEIVGENATVADIVPSGVWPSDHRGVVVEYQIELPNKAVNPSGGSGGF